MKVVLKKRVGDLELEIEAEGKDEKDIFPQLEFWTSLPTAHPSGAVDFQLRARPATTSAGKKVKYYEITCPSADQRFCFGQATEEAGGGLFPKGWEPIFHGTDEPRQDWQESRRDERPSQRPAAVPPSSRPVTTDDVTAQIYVEFKRLGINNPGLEKQTIMRALNMKVGALLVELAESEKADLLDYLRRLERRAA